MSIKTEVKQNIDKLADSTAFQVATGASDLAAEKLRQMQDRLAALDVQAALADVPQRLTVAGEKAQATLAAVPEKLAAMRAEPKAVQEAVQERARQLPERAQDLAAQFAGLAVQTYSELAERGRAVIDRRRGASGASGRTVARAEIVETGAEVAGRAPAGKAAAKPATKSAGSRPKAKAAAESRPSASRTSSSKSAQKSAQDS